MTPIMTKGIGTGGSMSFAGADAHMPDPILTDVLREGDPQFTVSFGEMVFPSLNVGRPFIRIPVHGGREQYRRHRTERGRKAKHTEIMDTVQTRTFGWARFGVKAGLDDIDTEFSDAAFRRMENLIFLLDEALRVDQEVIRQELLAVANWPANHAVDLTGNEWDDVGGDSAGDLRAAEAVIKAAHPWVQPEHLELILTFSAQEAALRDPTYLAARTAINYFQSSLEDWTAYAAARYQSVRVGELLVKDDINAVETELWGEQAILKIHDGAKRFVDEERGSRIFAREHLFTAGQVSSSWRDDDRTTNWMAVDRQNLQVVHDFTTAVLLFNMVK